MNKESLSAPIDSGYFLANPGISGPFADEKPKLTPSQERALPALHSSRPVADRRRACPRQGSRDRDAKRSQSRRSPMDSWPCRPIRTSSPIRSANEKRNEPNSAVQCPGVFTAAHRTRLAVSTKMTKRSQSRPISLGSTPLQPDPRFAITARRAKNRTKPIPPPPVAVIALDPDRLPPRQWRASPGRAASVSGPTFPPGRLLQLGSPPSQTREDKRTQSRAQWAAAKTNPISPKPAGLTRWTDPHRDSRHAGERVRRSKPVVTGHETHQMRNNLHP